MHVREVTRQQRRSLFHSASYETHVHTDVPKPTRSACAWCRNRRFPRHACSNPADLIRNLIPPREASLRDHPTDLTPLHTALSMLSPLAHANQKGNKAPGTGGGGLRRGNRYGCYTRPLRDALREGALWDPEPNRFLSTKAVITFH